MSDQTEAKLAYENAQREFEKAIDATDAAGSVGPRGNAESAFQGVSENGAARR